MNIDTGDMDSIIITGKVSHGHKLGRTIGFPTANVSLGNEGRDILNGVYAAVVTLPDGIQYKAMAYIGTRPSVDGDNAERRAEVFLFDFDGDLYGQTIMIKILQYIRSEARFDSVQQLKKAILNDQEAIKAYFEEL